MYILVICSIPCLQLLECINCCNVPVTVNRSDKTDGQYVQVIFLISYISLFNFNCWQHFCPTTQMLNGPGLRFQEQPKVGAQYGRHNIEAVDGARVANETWRLNRRRRVASGSCAWDSASSVNKHISRYLSKY